MSRSIQRGALAMFVALLAGACGGADNLIAPTTPAPVPISELFSGTLTRNAAITHPFATQAGGTVTATLTSVSPNAVIGISLGTWNGIACQIVIANDSAVQSSTVTGTASAVGNLCLRVYDVGQFTEATSYEVSVFHP